MIVENKILEISPNLSIDLVRKDIKNLHLAVYPPQGRVRIAAPLRIDDDAVRLFAISNLSWIKKQQRRFQSQERLSPRKFINRESHYFHGQRYLLKVIEGNTKPKVIIKKKQIELYVKQNASLEYRQAIMNKWYRKELTNDICELLNKWEGLIGVKASFCGIRLMKSKWGSCNPDTKKIWINLELAQKPLNCIEYIIVHELVHLLERHHNDKFMELMDLYLPKWRSYKDELNNLAICNRAWEY